MEGSDMTSNMNEVVAELRGQVGFITLNRPAALNALTLSMIRTLTTCLLTWGDDPRVHAVAIRGSNKAGPFGAFCAGGDIRFFHQALLSGDPTPEDFFTEEYTLNHLIHKYPKPFIAFMDGVVMGGGMGISQGATHRLVTGRTKMAMPETIIGLFPDVGGGYFLSRCPGFAGEWLALTGSTLGAGDAITLGLADHCFDYAQLHMAWDALATIKPAEPLQLKNWIATYSIASCTDCVGTSGQIDRFFSRNSVLDIVQNLEVDPSDWAQRTATQLRQRSPLMLNVALAQIRRARHMSIAQALRMERDMMRHCFYPLHLGRSGHQSDAAEGIRALVVDKDNAPQWTPPRVEDVAPEMAAAFFASPWQPHCHPLRHLT
jgi:enoyl-CoA hydratase/carnithine racemase